MLFLLSVVSRLKKKRQLSLIKLVGVPPGMCAVAVCVWMWVLLPPFGRGIASTRWCGGIGSEVDLSLSRVTFEPYQVLLWVWRGVKGEAMAVNEAEHTTGIVWKVVLPHPHRK